MIFDVCYHVLRCEAVAHSVTVTKEDINTLKDDWLTDNGHSLSLPAFAHC
jgi:hypothetical protein